MPIQSEKENILMATDFKILVHKNSENLHLKLIGDFDRTSAHEVLNALKKNCGGASRVFIHTSCLNRIHPFPRDVFHNQLNMLKKQSLLVAFTGQNSGKLIPNGKEFS
jgi:hypothetical protein